LTQSKLYFAILALVTLASFFVFKFIQQVDHTLPLINGVIIPNSKPLNEFLVLDHHNRRFNNKNLLGKWHLLTYGYTNCPDICPTTLSALVRLTNRLKSEQKYKDLGILFYSIDHQRDTVEHLKKYIPFFDDAFIGLTYKEDMKVSALELEKGLGMISILTPVVDDNKIAIYGSYRVSHGFMLYLINQLGHLQAVLKPSKGNDSESYFDEERIYRDYVSIRKHFD
jgi:protein SCO1/2